MKKLLYTITIYSFLILISLELMVRVFHLGKDTPLRYLDHNKVEKWKPNQKGYAVTGNRRQNFSEYRINNSGFNSYREFSPSYSQKEIALVGDSFIEGFHQHYQNSIGKKIEQQLTDTEVYEYGYAGYDLADQLHLIHAYKKDFDKIDQVFLGVKFSNDLTRDRYKVVQYRLNLDSPTNRLFKKSKLLVYAQNIGILDAPKRLINSLKAFVFPSQQTTSKKRTQKDTEVIYLANFEKLIKRYGFDKKRFTFLLDKENTSPLFIEHLEKNEYKYLDFSSEFSRSEKPKTLIYDKHWNNHGRDLIAKVIVDYIKKKP
ncbi:hypothetical protein HN014_18675 [Aquimarina sp. TRL1]|uniref:hypothetical protein n=1 Tax=Aquimarina sp. (strain TRL1) TaxID=2736252 RepID=UPI00158CB871|nr:hypothetical protein [Aquimarina sp. TRL1]QKX06855.1 hypothetical protein HN014_18675 [Aquimarina sp. TRL1]